MCGGIYDWRAGEFPQWPREGGDFAGSRAAIEVECRIDFSTVIQIRHLGSHLGCPHLRLEAVSPKLSPGPRLKSLCLQCLEAAGLRALPPQAASPHITRVIYCHSGCAFFDGFLPQYLHSPVEVSAREQTAVADTRHYKAPEQY